MGDRQNKEMYITKWLREKKNKFLRSKVFVFLLGCVISGSSIIIFYEGMPLYRYIHEGYSHTVFIQIRANQGQDSESLPDPAEDSYVESVAPAISSPAILKKIFQLESSSGKNDKCRREGLGFNGYGFGVYGGNYPCWETQEEIDGIVKDWIEKHIEEGLSEGQILCHYQQGTILDTCPYYIKSLSL